MSHIPVLLHEIIREASIFPADSVFADATFGGGGHSSALADMLDKNGILVATDRDRQILERNKPKLDGADCEILFKNIRFSELTDYLAYTGLYQLDFIMADLGVSSFQLDEGERGFSFMQNGPLDMRMDENSPTLLEKLKTTNFHELKTIIKKYGEEPEAHKIASVILSEIKKDNLKTTSDLSNLIERTVKRKKKGKHPATKTFQALRIWINNELEELETFLDKIPAFLAPDGKLAIITFHSLEDRIVKKKFKELAHPEKDIPPDLPLTKDEMPKPVFSENGPLLPSDKEIAGNPRARSAKLRILQRIL